MTWTVTKKGFAIEGKFKKKYYYFVCGGSDTGGSIVTGFKSIVSTVLVDKTGARADAAVDDTSVVGTVTVTGLTNSDKGYVIVTGK